MVKISFDPKPYFSLQILLAQHISMSVKKNYSEIQEKTKYKSNHINTLSIYKRLIYIFNGSGSATLKF